LIGRKLSDRYLNTKEVTSVTHDQKVTIRGLKTPERLTVTLNDGSTHVLEGTVPVNQFCNWVGASVTLIRNLPDADKTKVLTLLSKNASAEIRFRTDDTGTVLGVVGKDYTEVTNEQMIDAANSVLNEFGYTSHVDIDKYDQSKYRDWFYVNLNEVKEINGESIEAGFQIGNSVIGTSAIYIMPTYNRQVCANTLRLKRELVDKEDSRLRKHVGNIDVILDDFQTRLTDFLQNIFFVEESILTASTLKIKSIDELLKAAQTRRNLSTKTLNFITEGFQYEQKQYASNTETVWGVIQGLTGVNTHDNRIATTQRDAIDLTVNDLLQIRTEQELTEYLTIPARQTARRVA